MTDHNHQELTTQKNNAVSGNDAEDEINLLEYLLVVVKRKNMIIKVCAGALVLSCVIALLIPNVYISTARVLPPPDSKGGLSSLMGGMGDLAALAGVSLGGGSSAEMYVGMLKSRTISDAIIDQFQLMEVYDQEFRLKTYEALEDHVRFDVGKDDSILAIAVEDEDPQRAADMANAYLIQLQKINEKFNLATAGRERLFLEQRLALVKKDLQQSEENLKNFQENNKAIRIEAQATAIIDAIAAIKAELASREVELSVLLMSQTERSPQVRGLREGISKLKQQLRDLETTPEGKKMSSDIFIATSAVPALGLQYGRLLREFKVQEGLFELLTKQYEVAKISEAKDTAILQVLDTAVPADKKSKPSRSLIVLGAIFVAGFFAVMLAFVQEYSARMPAEDAARWQEIKQYLPKFNWRKNNKKQ